MLLRPGRSWNFFMEVEPSAALHDCSFMFASASFVTGGGIHRFYDYNMLFTCRLHSNAGLMKINDYNGYVAPPHGGAEDPALANDARSSGLPDYFLKIHKPRVATPNLLKQVHRIGMRFSAFGVPSGEFIRA